ncbi:MAG TPA: alginate export family protein [Lysobacter sp.]
MKAHRNVLASFGLLLPALAFAEPGVRVPEPVSWDWNLRLRHETVDDAGFANRAHIETARLRAGLTWGAARWLEARVEGEAIAALDAHANTTANGRVRYPTVADPNAAEINQAWLRWKADAGDITAGRQRLAIDNQRWIGNAGWRQNEQTFDAVDLRWRPGANMQLQYAWLDRVHRVNGDRAIDPLARERDLDARLARVHWAHGPHALSAYRYDIEDRDVRSASTVTDGLRYARAKTAGPWPVSVVVEAARQAPTGRPSVRRQPYRLIEPALHLSGAVLRVGWERLGGDGRDSVQAPLGSLHAFNGWADRFPVTPTAGLEDRYVSGAGTWKPLHSKPPVEWAVAWHDYRADAGGAAYGTELDVSLAVEPANGWRVMAKWADYRARAYSRDTSKLWLQLEWSGAAR